MSSEDRNAAEGRENARTRVWALFLGTTVAIATATALVAYGIRRARSASHLGDVGQIIDDCFERIRRIENDIHQLRPHAESAH